MRPPSSTSAVARVFPRARSSSDAAERWRGFVSDDDAAFDAELVLDAADLVPFVTWGTNPAQVVALSGVVPSPTDTADADERGTVERALEYMDFTPGTPLRAVPVDVVFIGSCTNSRIEDLRAAAAVAKGHKVKDGVRALVVPGSRRVKNQAEVEGLDQVFLDGRLRVARARVFDVLRHEPGHPYPGQRCASTSNRNFEGRQGTGWTNAPRLAGRRRGDGDHGSIRRSRGGRVRSVRVLEGRAVPLDRSDVDTDQIIPSDWLKRVERTGFGRGLFSEWRDDTTFVLNQPEYSSATILLAGPRFGTGSSREHAVWALMDYGFEAIIAPSFGDIFRNNSSKQGLVIVQLAVNEVDELSAMVKEDSIATGRRGRGASDVEVPETGLAPRLRARSR